MPSHAPQPEGKSSLPRHVAIIMDGNGRWAKARHLPRTAGHKKGANAVKETLEACAKAGVQYLTLYAFSAENWQRPQQEVEDLMNLLRSYIGNELDALHKQGIKLQIIGQREKLAPDIRQQLEEAISLTQHNTRLTLTVALSYGSRQEIVHAARRLAEQVADGKLPPGDITEHTLASAFYAPDVPDPDLLIRTGGEQRLSNFLLWQAAYAELYFTETLWPDFSAECLNEALASYSQRERRYGGV